MTRLILFWMATFIINVTATENLARQSYLNKNYTDAKDQYYGLVKASPNNFSHQYNLGASYFRLNETMLAKVHFLKALKLKPNDYDTLFNIKLINKTLIDQQFIFNRHWPHVFQWNLRSFVVVMLIGSTIILLFLFMFKNQSHVKKLRRPGMVGLFIWGSMLLFATVIHLNSSNYGLVIAEKTKVYSGPSATQKALFFAHEGAEFKIINSTKYWANVQFPNGLKGWIMGNEVIKI
jgi:tetratricopeptide (TPR) repeat protein